MGASVTVRVPATSANLGPGYDSFGLALALHDQFSAETADSWAVNVVGEGAGSYATDKENAVARAMARVFAEAGERRAAHVFCVNRIPDGRGLGSSAAAIAGGMLLADRLLSVSLGRDRLFELASDMEGHPDNVAAALFGGFTISWMEDGPRCERVDPAGGLAAVVVVSEYTLSTPHAREMLPDAVPHGDAAFNASRAALLAAGIALGRPELTRAGGHDRIHERHRAAEVPDLEVVRSALLNAGADAAMLSGAGPTVLGIVHEVADRVALARAKRVASAAEKALADLQTRARPVAIAVDREGACVV